MISEKKTEIEHQITKLLSHWHEREIELWYKKGAKKPPRESDNNFVIWCSILVFFSEIKNSTSFCDTYRIWEKSEKLCRFKYWLLCEGQKERNFDGSPEKNSYFFLRRARIKLFSKKPLLFHDLVACQISTIYEH